MQWQVNWQTLKPVKSNGALKGTESDTEDESDGSKSAASGDASNAGTEAADLDKVLHVTSACVISHPGPSGP